MRLQVVSDLHLEFHQDGGEALITEIIASRPENIDALVLAGDIFSLHRGSFPAVKRQLLRLSDAYPRIFYIPGNHEFYGLDPLEGMATLHGLAHWMPNVMILEPNRTLNYKNRWILGATMWFPYIKGDESFYHMMNDFQLIKNFPEWAYEHDREFRQYLEGKLQPGDVVITHHLPSRYSVHPLYAASPLNRFFVHDLTEFIEERQPALWIHGHTHHAFDYQIGETRVVCNPRGYPGRFGAPENARFDPGLVVEV